MRPRLRYLAEYVLRSRILPRRLGRQAIECGARISFGHVLVDEWHNCTVAQAWLLSALSPQVKSVKVVGDPLQSIYGFAGAGYTDQSSLIDGVRTYQLTQSFRLNHSNAALATALGRLVRPHMLPIKGMRAGGRKPTMVNCSSAYDQFQCVLGLNRSLIAKRVAPSQIAILGRVKMQLREIEGLLLAAGLDTTPLYCQRDPTHVENVLKLVDEIQGRAGKPWRARLREHMRKLAGDRPIAESTVDDHVRKLLRVVGTSLSSQYTVCAKAHVSALGRKDLAKDAISDINRWQLISQRHATAGDMRQEIAALIAQDKVITSNVHQAKGFQWDHVIILHAVDGSWPLFKAKTKSAVIEEVHALRSPVHLLCPL